MEIRDARPDEYEAVGELTVLAYSRLDGSPALDTYEVEMRAIPDRADSTSVVVADYAGRIVGTVTYVPGLGPYAEFEDADAAGVRFLAVAPDAQGRGIGSALMDVCIKRARAEGRQKIVLHTTPWMTTAQRMYERLGFVRTPDRDWSPRPGVDLLGYELDLAPASPA